MSYRPSNIQYDTDNDDNDDYNRLSSHDTRTPSTPSVDLSELDTIPILDPDEGAYDYTAHSRLLSFKKGISPPPNTPTLSASYTLDAAVVLAQLSELSSASETPEQTHEQLARILRSAPCANALNRCEVYHCSTISLRLTLCPGSEHTRTSHYALYTAHPLSDVYSDLGARWRLRTCSRPDLHGLQPDVLTWALGTYERQLHQPSERTRSRRARRHQA